MPDDAHPTNTAIKSSTHICNTHTHALVRPLKCEHARAFATYYSKQNTRQRVMRCANSAHAVTNASTPPKRFRAPYVCAAYGLFMCVYNTIIICLQQLYVRASVFIWQREETQWVSDEQSRNCCGQWGMRHGTHARQPRSWANEWPDSSALDAYSMRTVHVRRSEWSVSSATSWQVQSLSNIWDVFYNVGNVNWKTISRCRISC